MTIKRQRNGTNDNEPKLFTPFATDRMEDYVALSLAMIIIIIVLLIHQ